MLQDITTLWKTVEEISNNVETTDLIISIYIKGAQNTWIRGKVKLVDEIYTR